MWSDGVVVDAPLFDDDLCLLQGVKDLTIQELVSEAGIEGLAASVLPRRAGFNVGDFGSDRINPVPVGLGHELYRYTAYDAPGWLVSPDSLHQNELVQGQIRYRSS